MEWKSPPNKLTLKSNEAHIWRANLDSSESNLNIYQNLLTSDEIQRANRFKFNRHRSRFILARGILRSLIGEYLEIKPANIEFQYGDYGKPFFPNKKTIKFNISHSKQIAVFVFTKKFEVGIDVEFLKRDIEFEEIAKRFFSKNEVKNFLALPKKDKLQGFYNCWTRKEAFIKAVGEGLSFPLDTFEVSIEPTKKAKLIATHWNPKDIEKWSVKSFVPFENFIGGLFVKGRLNEIQFFDVREFNSK